VAGPESAESVLATDVCATARAAPWTGNTKERLMMIHPEIHGVLARERTRTFLAQADMARWARRLARPRGWLAGGKRIRLRDGLARLTRPVRPADDGLLADGFARLSHAGRRDHEALGALTTSAGAAWPAASCGHRGIDVTYPDALPAE
jgi:hypothetical protein